MQTCAKILNLAGLVVGFGGAILLVIDSQIPTGATTRADMEFVKKSNWFFFGVVSLGLGFLFQLIAAGLSW
jgi:hypothetical protein